MPRIINANSKGDDMFCSKCATELPSGGNFCGNCGSPTNAIEPAIQPNGQVNQKRLRWRTALMPILALVILWGGSAAISYGIVSTAEGPRGEQGEQGDSGPRGPAGASGPSGSSASTNDAALTRLAAMWALNTVIEEFDKTGLTAASDPQVKACIDYVLDGVGSFTECGFQR